MTTFPIKISATQIVSIKPIAYGYVEQVEVKAICCDLKELLDQLCDQSQPEFFEYIARHFDGEELKERLGL